jgi:ABC-type oligopeptide transport system ATPase subunit
MTGKCLLGLHDDEDGDVVRTGKVIATGAGNGWAVAFEEPMEIRKCRKCNKEVMWSYRQHLGWTRV